jgi:hypothetical protein
MHARDFVKLAAIVVGQADRPWLDETAISEHSLQGYWAASRQRQEQWERDLRVFRTAREKGGGGGARNAWHLLRPVLDEILLSEILTRVMGAVLTQRDRLAERRPPPTPPACRPIVRAVFLRHLGARENVLDLMQSLSAVSPAEAMSLHRLRRRCDQWTDLLLSPLVASGDVWEYAIHLERAARWASILELPTRGYSRSPHWSAIHATLQRTFFPTSRIASPHGDLNARIAASVLVWAGAGRHRVPDEPGPNVPPLPRNVAPGGHLWTDEFLRDEVEQVGRLGRDGLPRRRSDLADSDTRPHRFRHFR